MLRRVLLPPSSTGNTARSSSASRGAPKAAKACKNPAMVEVANGIAIVRPHCEHDVSGCLRQRPPMKTLEDTLSLVNGEPPTFLSFACRHHRNKRQQEAHAHRMNLKTSGVAVPPHKNAERRRLERDGGVLIMDDYLNRHGDAPVAQVSLAYREHFASRPPRANPHAPPRQRLSKMTQYLVDEAAHGHRPIFERIPTSEVYGDGCEYTPLADGARVEAPPIPAGELSAWQNTILGDGKVVSAGLRQLVTDDDDGGRVCEGSTTSSCRSDVYSLATPIEKGRGSVVIDVCVEGVEVLA